MVEQDFKKFYESLNHELMAVKDRLRSLIGDRHWGKEGEYKEAVLKNIIAKFLPKQYSMGTGFVINAKRELTKQIDIIIYDNSSPILFSEGDFIIVPANTVKAIIEVKSSIKSTRTLKNIIKTCEDNAKKIELNFSLSQQMFNGIFCYECDLLFNTIKHSLRNCYNLSECSIYRKINNISLGEEKFIHLWDSQPFSLIGYKLKNLSFAYFISNLLAVLDPHNYENRSLFFPLKSKNPYEEFKIDYPPEFKRW